MEGFEAFYDKGGVAKKGNIAKPYLEPSMALIPCRKKDNIIGGNNSLCFSLIHYEYIYKSQSNLPNRLQLYKTSFLIGYNSICKVDICYNIIQGPSMDFMIWNWKLWHPFFVSTNVLVHEDDDKFERN